MKLYQRGGKTMSILKIKKEKGITLAILVITVFILIIITSVMARNSFSSITISKLTRLQNDIEQLNDRVAAYYVETGKLPINEEETPMNKVDLSSVLNDMSINDGENYYTIDLNKLDNLSLNYGKGKKTNDKYIINEETHVVYYYLGIEYEGEKYHTFGSNPSIVK